MTVPASFHHTADPGVFMHAQMQSAAVETDSPHLEAATHTGEAPPAYHAAALYQTVPSGTVTQSEDSVHKDSSSKAPPPYRYHWT